MPGIDQRKPNFQNQLQSANRTEARTVNEPAIRQSSSISPKKIVQSHIEKKIEQNIEKKEAINNSEVKKAEEKQFNNEVKKQKHIQADGFQKADLQNHKKSHLSISQYAADIKDKKQRQQETQSLAQNINNAQLGQLRTKLNNPHNKSSAEETQTTSLASQAHLEAIDPDISNEEKRANKLLQEIHDRGGDKGKGFTAFARREISKGRLIDIIDLIEGYHKSLKGSSLSASEMVESGEEPLLTVKNMISSNNPEELHILNQKIVARPDASVGFKRDQLHVRNISGSQRVAPPSFYKSTKLSKVEEVIRFVSTIHNAVLNAPWDKIA